MYFKDFIEMYDNLNGKIRINDDELKTIATGTIHAIVSQRHDLDEKEVVAFGHYDGELTVRIAEPQKQERVYAVVHHYTFDREVTADLICGYNEARKFVCDHFVHAMNNEFAKDSINFNNTYYCDGYAQIEWVPALEASDEPEIYICEVVAVEELKPTRYANAL